MVALIESWVVLYTKKYFVKKIVNCICPNQLNIFLCKLKSVSDGSIVGWPHSHGVPGGAVLHLVVDGVLRLRHLLGIKKLRKEKIQKKTT